MATWVNLCQIISLHALQKQLWSKEHFYLLIVLLQGIYIILPQWWTSPGQPTVSAVKQTFLLWNGNVQGSLLWHKQPCLGPGTMQHTPMHRTHRHTGTDAHKQCYWNYFNNKPCKASFFKRVLLQPSDSLWLACRLHSETHDPSHPQPSFWNSSLAKVVSDKEYTAIILLLIHLNKLSSLHFCRALLLELTYVSVILIKDIHRFSSSLLNNQMEKQTMARKSNKARNNILTTAG